MGNTILSFFPFYRLCDGRVYQCRLEKAAVLSENSRSFA